MRVHPRLPVTCDLCDATPRHPPQKRVSVVEISKAERYCNGEPVSGGLYDLRLGVTDFNTRCETCGNTYRGSNRVNDCPGHFGHIEVRCHSVVLYVFLRFQRVTSARPSCVAPQSYDGEMLLYSQLAKPMFHIGFLAEVYKLLQCVCFKCSKLRLTDREALAEVLKYKNGKRRLVECMVRSKSVRRCGEGGLGEGGCNYTQVSGVCVAGSRPRLGAEASRSHVFLNRAAAQVLPRRHQPVRGVPGHL